MRFDISKHGRSTIVALGLAIAAGSMERAEADVISATPTFPPNPISFASPTGAGCFDLAKVCVTPGVFTVTSPVSTFLPAVQDIAGDANYTGSLTPLPPKTGSLGSFTLTGTVQLEVIGRTSATETGSWTADLTSLSLKGPLLSLGTLTASLDTQNPSTGSVSITPIGQNGKEFLITSFFDIFIDVTLDRPAGLPPLSTSVGPIGVAAVTTPEPATWAMLVLGFMGLGLAAARRSAAPV